MRRDTAGAISRLNCGPAPCVKRAPSASLEKVGGRARTKRRQERRTLLREGVTHCRIPHRRDSQIENTRYVGPNCVLKSSSEAKSFMSCVSCSQNEKKKALKKNENEAETEALAATPARAKAKARDSRENPKAKEAHERQGVLQWNDA